MSACGPSGHSKRRHAPAGRVNSRKSTRIPRALLSPRLKELVDPVQSRNGDKSVLPWAVPPKGLSHHILHYDDAVSRFWHLGASKGAPHHVIAIVRASVALKSVGPRSTYWPIGRIVV